jgi:hypothetical protein
VISSGIQYQFYGIPDKAGRENANNLRKGATFNPDIAAAICCGLQILAATLVYCFYCPVLLTGPQKIIEIANSGMVFQEYDDIDNTTSVNQMSWGETFWMYIWMLVMLFMGPMM